MTNAEDEKSMIHLWSIPAPEKQRPCGGSMVHQLRKHPWFAPLGDLLCHRHRLCKIYLDRHQWQRCAFLARLLQRQQPQLGIDLHHILDDQHLMEELWRYITHTQVKLGVFDFGARFGVAMDQGPLDKK